MLHKFDMRRNPDSVAVVASASMQQLHRLADRLEFLLREAQSVRDRAERMLLRSRERSYCLIDTTRRDPVSSP